MKRKRYSTRVCRSSIAGGSDIGRIYCCRPSGHRGWHKCTEDGRGPQWRTPTRRYVVVKH